MDIRKAALRDPPQNHGIFYGMEFAGLEACHNAKLDMIKWIRNEYTFEEKAKIMAWSQLHQLIELHQSESIRRKPKRKGK